MGRLANTDWVGAVDHFNQIGMKKRVREGLSEKIEVND